MATREFTDETVEAVRGFLGEDGISFFRGCLRDYGTLIAVLTVEVNGRKFPHPVHFREGMQVRNFLRTLEGCEDWDAHELDDTWAEIVEAAIR